MTFGLSQTDLRETGGIKHLQALATHPPSFLSVSFTVLPSFGLSQGSFVTAKDTWKTMVQDGQFERKNFDSGPSMPSSVGETLCAAVSASAWVEPHGKCTVAFALAWSSPKVKFLKGSSYYRRYTKFYGTSERAALDLVHDALKNYKRWEEEIETWQNPILKDERLPEWYKFTLFNELYFLVAGGTVWIDSALPDECVRGHPNAMRKVEERNARAIRGKADQRESTISGHLATLRSNESNRTVFDNLPCKEAFSLLGGQKKDMVIVQVLMAHHLCATEFKLLVDCNFPSICIHSGMSIKERLANCT